jgi:hypothetical protein
VLDRRAPGGAHGHGPGVNVLKNALISSILFIFLSAPAFADVNLDAYGAYLGTGKNINQAGGGGGLGVTVIDNFAIIYRGMYTVGSKQNSGYTERQFSHQMQMGGLEYVLKIPVIRIGWRTSLMAGYSETRFDARDYETNFLESVVMPPMTPGVYRGYNVFKVRHLRDSGFSMGLWTGIQVNVLNFLAPFVDIGLHKSFYYRDLEGKSIMGLHLMFGIRYSFIAGGNDYW